MREAYHIISDGSCDLPQEKEKKKNITVVPFYVSFDSETYEKEIVKHASQIIDETKCIWPKTRDNVFTVVREFNMTKGNIFPNEMLSDPKKAICMFVKKREIIRTGI